MKSLLLLAVLSAGPRGFDGARGQTGDTGGQGPQGVSAAHHRAHVPSTSCAEHGATSRTCPLHGLRSMVFGASPARACPAGQHDKLCLKHVTDSF